MTPIFLKIQTIHVSSFSMGLGAQGQPLLQVYTPPSFTARHWKVHCSIGKKSFNHHFSGVILNFDGVDGTSILGAKNIFLGLKTFIVHGFGVGSISSPI